MKASQNNKYEITKTAGLLQVWTKETIDGSMQFDI